MYTRTRSYAHTTHTHTHTHTASSRVLTLLDSCRDKVVYGGDSDESQLYISPTLITNVSGEDEVMKEEVFGPLLLFVTVENVDKAIEFMNDR